MELDPNLKTIDGIIYKPSWVDTFRALKPGEEIKLSRTQIMIYSARATCDWIRKKDSTYKFQITGCDRYQDNFIVKRI